MQKNTLQELTQKGKELFSKLAKSYAYNGVDLLMTDLVPQRGGILSEAVDEGATAYIAGGKGGQQFFKNIPQFSPEFDTFTRRTNDTVGEIVSCLPKDLCSDKIALFLYVPMGDCMWSKAVEEHTGSKVIATNEQNFRSYFEEKTNLSDILRAAGLSQHIIPSEVIRHNRSLTSEEAQALYEQYADADGKIVVQYCGEGCTEKGGGYSTRVIGNYEEFASVCAEPRDSYMKVAKFITGYNSNLSICAGNLVPATGMLGAVKNNLTESESRFSGATIYSLLHRARGMGINENNIIVNVQPSTLKVVGAPQLTSIETNGVGNQLNYNFEPQILEGIYNLGERLGTLMAMCGKVGLCGADLIITKDGEIYVNEINDRQQGPTESAGLNNEAHGLPALHRTSFFLNFGNLHNAEMQAYLSEVGSRSREIFDEALQIPSPFYIKFISKYSGVAKQDVRAGNYELGQDLFGRWNWNLSEPVEGLDGALPVVDLSQGSTVVNINTVSMNQGDFFPKETQLLRINGVSMPGSAPFSISKDGKSVLSKDWEAPIEALYSAVLDRTQTHAPIEDMLGTMVDLPTDTYVFDETPIEEVAKAEAKPEEGVPADEEGRRAYMQQIENLLVRSTVASDSKIETQDGGQGTN